MCYIDDIVIPNVFKTMESRNNKSYISVNVGGVSPTSYNNIIILQDGYYNGLSFAEQITNTLKIFTEYIHEMRVDLIFDITASYDSLSNTLSI